MGQSSSTEDRISERRFGKIPESVSSDEKSTSHQKKTKRYVPKKYNSGQIFPTQTQPGNINCPSGATFPNDPVEGEVFFNTTTNTMYIRVCRDWTPVSVNEPGPTGATGPIGATGPTGPMGPTGSTGTCPFIFSMGTRPIENFLAVVPNAAPFLITITNNGNTVTECTIEDSQDSPFVLTQLSSDTIDSGGSVTFTITFNPPVPAYYSDNIILYVSKNQSCGILNIRGIYPGLNVV
jgi:hypothetical protein